jgi:hypothetical protein
LSASKGIVTKSNILVPVFRPRLVSYIMWRDGDKGLQRSAVCGNPKLRPRLCFSEDI